MERMMKPTIHLNGTSKSALTEDYEEAVSYVDRALNCVARKAAPNGRDYYVQGPDALAAAVKEHESRLERLRAVRDELVEIYESICDAPSR